jgi:hypothetical protein
MTAILKAISSTFTGRTPEECDTIFPVLMFTIASLILAIALVLAHGAPSFAGFETF